MPTALVAGSFGRRDPGEEAILDAVLRALPGWDAVIASRDPGATERRHARGAFHIQNQLSLARVAMTADATILAGSFLEGFGMSEREAARQIGALYALLEATRAMGKPAAMVGVGSGPVASRPARMLARRLVKRADLLVLRDGPSAQRLADVGAKAPFRVGADPAWALVEEDGGVLPMRAAEDANGDGRRSLVSVSLDAAACDAGLAERLGKALGRMVSESVDVRLEPWRRGTDGADHLRLAGEVATHVSGAVDVSDPPHGLAHAAISFEGSSLVVAMRRHALMAAALAGVPSLAIAHEPGIADLARRLGQPWVPANATVDELAVGLRGAIERPPPTASAIKGQASSAEEGFRLLRLLLTSGESDDVHHLAGLPLEPPASA